MEPKQENQPDESTEESANSDTGASTSETTTPVSDQHKMLFLIGGVAVLLIVIVGVMLYKMGGEKTRVLPASNEQTVNTAEEALQGIEQISGNPLEQSPDLNPVERTNPFTDVYKNPFE